MNEFKNIFGNTERSSNTIWISTTDLMSGLMIVFMFIAITYMMLIDMKSDQTYEIVKEWDRSKMKLVEALHEEFDKDLLKWEAMINDSELSIIFSKPEILFKPGKSSLKPEFQVILNNFFPRYLKRLDQHKGLIAEIRIEGHTSKEWLNATDTGAYLNNMELSQDRTRSVLRHCLINIGHLIVDELTWARQKITANGLSSSNLYFSDGKYDQEKSRRVEFRIRTNAEERIEKILARR